MEEEEENSKMMVSTKYLFVNIFSLTHSSPTGAPAEKVPRGDFEDLETHSNESSSHLPFRCETTIVNNYEVQNSLDNNSSTV